MSDSVRPHRWQPTRLLCPWDSPGKNTGVGCHYLLQCMKVKSESEVAQSCPTLSDPMDCSPPGSSVCGILQARVLEWGAIAFSLAPIYDMANLCPLHYLTQTYLLWMWWEECDWRVGSEMVFGCPRDKTIFLKKALPFRDSGYHWLWT